MGLINSLKARPRWGNASVTYSIAMDSDASVKRQLVEERGVVRQKYLDLKRDYIDADLARNAALEPILTPLRKLAKVQQVESPKLEPKLELKYESSPESTSNLKTPKRSTSLLMPPIRKLSSKISSEYPVSPIPGSTPKRSTPKDFGSFNSTGVRRLFPTPTPMKRNLGPGIIEAWDATLTPKRTAPDRYQSIKSQQQPGSSRQSFVETSQLINLDSIDEAGELEPLEEYEEEYQDGQGNVLEYDEHELLEGRYAEKDVSEHMYEGAGDTIKEYLLWQISNHRGSDHTYGLKQSPEGVMLGNTYLTLQDDTIIVDGDTYPATRGLLELLVKKEPDMVTVTDDDLLKYKDLLTKTNAHLQKYQPNAKIMSTKGVKYMTVIRKLFPPKLETLKVGAGTSYIFWDNPNELVERLKLLVASKNAGHTNHDNEIISIIEELKEAHYVQ